MAKEVSPEEYEKIVAAGKIGKSTGANHTKPLLALIVVVLLCAASFFAGQSYQKHYDKNPTAAAGRLGQQGGREGFGFGNGQRPSGGQVTAVSSDSITINNTRTGASQAFKITSTTTVDSNGSTASASDIKTGDTVFIQTSTSDTSTATRIILNPMSQAAQDNTTTN